MKDKLLRFPVVFLLLLSSINILHADQWNVATGGNPARYGYCSINGPVDTTKLWQGGAYSVIAWQPVIDGDLVVMARCTDLNDVLHGTYIYAYDLHSGTELWTVDLPVDFPSTDWRNHVSAIRDSVVYVSRAGNTNASYLYALNALDGTQLWKSADLIDEPSTEGLSFTPDGDLIVGNYDQILRIDADDGTNVWTTIRNSPTSSGSEVAVFNGKVYGWTAGASGPTINVYDLTSGNYLYQSDPVGGGYIQQVGLFIGPDGTVYAPRSQNNATTDYLVAFADSGNQLTEKWRVKLGYVPFSSFAVGPDGSVYSYNRNGAVIRIKPDNGLVIDSSPDIQAGIRTRMAIEGLGIIYVISDDTLYSFNPDLSLRWRECIQGLNGPAIGYDGTLVVCGRGTDIRAYPGNMNAVSEPPLVIYDYPEYDIRIINSTVIDQAKIAFFLPISSEVTIKIYSSEGRLWYREELGTISAGRSYRNIDVSDFPAGIYLVQLGVRGNYMDSDHLIILK